MSKAKKPATKPSRVKPASTKRTVFLVVRAGLSVSQYRGRLPQYQPDTGSHVDIAAEVPVRAFATNAAAAAYAHVLDAEVRDAFPPPLLAAVFGRDDAAARQAIADKVKALGLPTIKFGKQPAYEYPEQFRKWWAENAVDMSAEQKAALWEPFAGMTFHSVKQVEVEE